MIECLQWVLLEIAMHVLQKQSVKTAELCTSSNTLKWLVDGVNHRNCLRSMDTHHDIWVSMCQCMVAILPLVHLERLSMTLIGKTRMKRTIAQDQCSYIPPALVTTHGLSNRSFT